MPLGFEVRNGPATLQVRSMCNLYSITTNQAAIIALFRVLNPYVGNLAPMPSVFPDYPAPVVRDAGADREMVMMRWGMPPPPRAGGYPITNIRNTTSPHWRGWLKLESRCLVPVNSFAEYAPEPNPATGKKDVVWFALNDDRPLFAFAGIWTEFRGDRGTKTPPRVCTSCSHGTGRRSLRQSLPDVTRYPDRGLRGLVILEGRRLALRDAPVV